MTDSQQPTLHEDVQLVRDLATVKVKSYHGRDRASAQIKPHAHRPDIVTVDAAGTFRVDALISGIREAEAEARRAPR